MVIVHPTKIYVNNKYGTKFHTKMSIGIYNIYKREVCVWIMHNGFLNESRS